MSPESALLLARFRLAIARRPDLLHRAPWYRVEGERILAIARAAGVDPDRAVQAAATLSPACRWETLMSRLPGFFRVWAAWALPTPVYSQDGTRLPDGPGIIPGPALAPSFPGYRANVLKAWRILSGLQGPRGPKVTKFALNLAGDDSPVTVDRWAARAAGLPELGGPAWYRRVEAAYRDAAKRLGLPPSRVQAILWVAVRDRIVSWGPARTLQPSLPIQDDPGSTIAGNLTGESSERRRSPRASY